MHYRTLIISDIHIWAPDSKHKEALNFLKKHTFDHLILNGDIIDGIYLKFFGGRKDHHNALLNYAKDLAKKWLSKVTYIIGNHDENYHKKLWIDLEDIELTSHLTYKSGTKTYFICHGQQLDGKTSKSMETIGFLWGVFVYRLNRVYNKRRSEQKFGYHSIVAQIKNAAKFVMVGSPNKVHNKIKRICKEYEADGFICGHLHQPINIFIEQLHYLNSWDRVESMTVVAETPDHEWNLLYHE